MRQVIIETEHEVIYISGTLRANHWLAIKTTAYLVYASHPLGVTLDFGGIKGVCSGGEDTFADAVADIERHALPFTLAHVPADVAAQMGRRAENPVFSRGAKGVEERRIRQAIYSEAWWQRLWGAI